LHISLKFPFFSDEGQFFKLSKTTSAAPNQSQTTITTALAPNQSQTTTTTTTSLVPNHSQTTLTSIPTANTQATTSTQSRLYEFPPVPLFCQTQVPGASQVNNFNYNLNEQPPIPHTIAAPLQTLSASSAVTAVAAFPQTSNNQKFPPLSSIHKQKVLQKPSLKAAASGQSSVLTPSEVTLFRLSSKIDTLSETIQNNNVQQNNNRHRDNQQQIQTLLARRPSPDNRGRAVSPHFQQHLFNQIFKNKLIRTFTEDAIYAHPFEHFVINAPEEIFRITSKFLKILYKSTLLEKRSLLNDFFLSFNKKKTI
jgi:hypothetical protein